MGSSIGQPRRAKRRQQHVMGRREEEKREIEEEDRATEERATERAGSHVGCSRLGEYVRSYDPTSAGDYHDQIAMEADACGRLGEYVRSYEL